jgi:acyl-CoA thioester hydrolase
MRGEIEIRVRYNECDPMGVAHHAAYAVWFEMGRTELLRTTGLTYRELEEAGVFLAIVRLEVTYRRAAKYDDLLRLETVVERVGRVKIEHRYRLLREGAVLATAASTLACLDAAGRAQAIPDTLVRACAGSDAEDGR